MNIAVIPARGGSKRIPRKNIKDFCGKPIITYSIDVAKKSGIFEEIIVSTDDNEIASISKSFGAQVPFLRPSNISDDFSTTGDVMRHAISWLENKKKFPDVVCCIYPTAPLLLKTDLIKAYNEFKSNKWSYVFSATRFSFPIQRAFKKLESKGIQMFQSEHYSSRSQDIEVAYHDAGQFYFGKKESWLKKEMIFDINSEIIVLPNSRTQDIDNLEDWKEAEIKFNLLSKND